MDDWKLLEQYASGNSEEAFRILVDRYAGMVYHMALRRLGNPHAAEEVAQAVFIALARKAGRMRPKTTLYGWLFSATRFAVLNELRREHRRQRHQREISSMQSPTEPQDSDQLWEQIAAHLDDALETLSAADREIVMVRFFGNKSHKDAAEALGLSEEAARKRLSRAIERLRVIFAERGVAASPVAVAAAFAAHGAQAAPVGVVSAVVVAAKGGGGAATLSSAKGILKLMAWAKVKWAAAVGIGVAFAAATATVALKETAPTPTNAALPPEVRQEWEKQKAAMNALYFECSEISATVGRTNLYESTYTAYFDGNRFYRHGPLGDRDDECAFDGNIFYRLEHAGGGFRDNFLSKYSPSDKTDPERCYRAWDFHYLDAAGILAPAYLTELEDFSGLEPLALYCLDQSPAPKVENAGEFLRVTFQAPDRLLINNRGFDLETVRKQADNGANSKAFVASEVANVKRFHAMKPVRTIAFLLDPKRGYIALERDEWTANGKHIAHIASDDWRFYEGAGLWLPGRCVATFYTWPYQLDKFSNQPVEIRTNLLQRAEPGQKDTQFVLNCDQPRTFIIDRTTPEARAAPDHKVETYIPAQETEAQRRPHKAMPRAKQPAAQSRSAWLRWPLWTAGLCAAMLCCVYFIRKGQSRSP